MTRRATRLQRRYGLVLTLTTTVHVHSTVEPTLDGVAVRQLVTRRATRLQRRHRLVLTLATTVHVHLVLKETTVHMA